MTGGEPPHPPSRSQYPPWQGRGYRRRVGGPPAAAAARNGWVGRRPRSPPPSALRARHPRPALHKHHRHAPPHHPLPPPPQSQMGPYHHHGPPPLSRSLQSRLRTSSRSPPPRRMEPPLHRVEQHPHRHEPPPHRADPHLHRPEQHHQRPEQHLHRPDHHPHRPDQHPNRTEIHSFRAEPHPYRGEPGPAHRVDPPDRGGYRGAKSFDHGSHRGADYDYRPRVALGKSRGDMSSYRPEQGSLRPIADHPVPYRGEPGPLYRADSGLHHEEPDVRRTGPDGSMNRNELGSHGPWFRNPSKIHKPAKLKKRRLPQHVSGALRLASQSSLKPESPILSRVGFPHPDRAAVGTIPDASSSPANFSAKPSTSSFPGSSGRWHADLPARYGGTASPHSFSHDGEAVKRGERNLRFHNTSGPGFGPGRRPPLVVRPRTSSPNVDGNSSRLGTIFRRSSPSPKDSGSFCPSSSTATGRDHAQEASRHLIIAEKLNFSVLRPPPQEGALERLPVARGKVLDRLRQPASARTSASPEEADAGVLLTSTPNGLLTVQCEKRVATSSKQDDVKGSVDAICALSSKALQPKVSAPCESRLESDTEKACRSALDGCKVADRPMIPPVELEGNVRNASPSVSKGAIVKSERPTQDGSQGCVPMGPSSKVSPSVCAQAVGALPKVEGASTSRKRQRSEVTMNGLRTEPESIACEEAVEVYSTGTPNSPSLKQKAGKVPSDTIHPGRRRRIGVAVKIEGKTTQESDEIGLIKTGRGPDPAGPSLGNANITGTREQEGQGPLREPNGQLEDPSQVPVSGNKVHGQRSWSEKLSEGLKVNAVWKEKSTSPDNDKQNQFFSASPPGLLDRQETLSLQPKPVIGKCSNPALASNRLSSPPNDRVAASAHQKLGFVAKTELRSVLSSLQLQPSPSLSVPQALGQGASRVSEQQKPGGAVSAPPFDATLPMLSIHKVPEPAGRVPLGQGRKSRTKGIDLRSVLSSTKSLAAEPPVHSSARMPHEPELRSESVTSRPASSSQALQNPSSPHLQLWSTPIRSFSDRLGVECTLKSPSSFGPNASASERLTSPRGDSIPAPVPQTPVSVPASAMSFLRSSPRSRPRGIVSGPAVNSISALMRTSSLKVQSPRPPPQNGLERNVLVKEIHATEEGISALERKVSLLRASSRGASNVENPAQRQVIPAEDSNQEAYGKIASLAVAIAQEADDKPAHVPKLSLHPMNAQLRLVLGQNRAKAASASAALRPICSDTEVGLDASQGEEIGSLVGALSGEKRARIAEEMLRKRNSSLARKKRLGREYSDLREAWLRKLKSARDKKSKEKREAIRERDRFLVLCTKGQNARLSSRTSSGRMSTKIFPSLNPFGQVSGTADVDALLAEIALEGGTPGSKNIWSKTLVAVPDQDPSAIPCDCHSVLVEDPLADFHASRAVNPWRFEEKLVFLEKFLMYPKNFRKISGFLEHKSSEECSYFYYTNKLDLGLKQLCKESSTMKRKGTLRTNIVALARKKPSFECEQLMATQAAAFLEKQTLVGNVQQQKPMGSNGLLPLPFGIPEASPASNEKKRSAAMGMMLKKRIYAESASFDLTTIDRDTFSSAIAKHGMDWRQISSFMGLSGKSSTHYREYYRRNRRKLRVDNVEKMESVRSPAPSSRHSPRITPRSSPRSSPTSLKNRLLRGSDLVDAVPMMLTDGIGSIEGRKVPHPSTSSLNRGSGLPSEMPVNSMLGGPDGENVAENENRRSKTSTWTPDEMETFKQLFRKYGRDWKKIAHLMAPKTPTQVKGFWRTVADEVGDGLPNDSNKGSKGERKKAKRSNYCDAMPRLVQGDEGEEKSAHEKLSCSAKSGGLPSEVGLHDGSTREGPATKSTDCDGEVEVRRFRNVKREECTANSSESPTRMKSAVHSTVSVEAPIEVSAHHKNQQSLEDGAVRNDMNVAGRPFRCLPLLRSSPPPVLRSVPLEKKLSFRARHFPSSPSASSARNETGGSPGQESRDAHDGGRDKELRRAAESYGVLQLLGNRLNEAAAESRKKEQ